MKKELNKNNNKRELFGVEIMIDLFKNNYNPKYELRKEDIKLTYEEKEQLCRNLFN